MPASPKSSAFQRRCIVNVRYASARTPGGWKAHGTYIERESAKGDRLPSEREAATEFGSQVSDPDRLGLAQEHPLGRLAESWQKAGDKRIFKIILSPEDPNVDFQRTASEMIARIEQYTGAPVEWEVWSTATPTIPTLTSLCAAGCGPGNRSCFPRT